MKNELRTILLMLYLCPVMYLSGQNTLATLGDMHSVSKGETWESIAAAYGISVAELQAANPDVNNKKKLKKRTLLILPKATSITSERGANGQGNLETLTISSKERGETSLIRTSISSLNVGVLLPFSDVKMVEFYRGFLMAADSVRKGGVNLDIHAWDCGSTTAQIESLQPQFGRMDVLIGPVSATQTPAVAEVCRESGTRLVLPFSNSLPLQDYPLIYNAEAPSSVVYDVAIGKLMNYYPNRNYIVIHSANTDNRGKALSETLVQKLTRQSVAPRFLELESDGFAYEKAFNQFSDNVILIDDSSVRSLNILLAHLKEFRQKHPNYRLSLLGYPEWQDETQRLLGDFFALDTYIISPYYYNVLDDRTKNFQRTYEKFFRTPIVQNNPRYAALGFDLGLYFLKGISSLGDTFEQMQSGLHQEPYQNWFQFERNASGMSFTNHFVQFVHFTPESKIELIR